MYINIYINIYILRRGYFSDPVRVSILKLLFYLTCSSVMETPKVQQFFTIVGLTFLSVLLCI